MNAKLLQLANWGCNIKDALPRFLNDEEFMLECIIQVSEDPAFEDLGKYLAESDCRQAFEAGHSLKGIIANTGLDPLYKIITEIVEPLRKGSMEGLMQSYEKLIMTRQELKEILN